MILKYNIYLNKNKKENYLSILLISCYKKHSYEE